MTVKEIKIAVSSLNDEIDGLSKQLIKIVISNRISELKKSMLETSDKKQLNAMTRKVKILQKPDGQDFYSNIENVATKRLTEMLVNACDNINIDLINAEFFNFSGRLK